MPAFPFHKQDCDTHCGPACLMMMLASRNVPLAGMYQSNLKQTVRTIGAGSNIAWESPPPAVAAVANTHLLGAPRGGITYEEYPRPADAEPDDATFAQAIRDCLDATHAPVFVLTESSGHWILIYDRIGARFKVRSPGSRRLDCDDQEEHDSTDGKCSKCGRGRNKVLNEEELFLTFTNIISDDPIYDGRRVLIVPRRIPGVPLPPPLS